MMINHKSIRKHLLAVVQIHRQSSKKKFNFTHSLWGQGRHIGNNPCKLERRLYSEVPCKRPCTLIGHESHSPLIPPRHLIDPCRKCWNVK